MTSSFIVAALLLLPGGATGHSDAGARLPAPSIVFDKTPGVAAEKTPAVFLAQDPALKGRPPGCPGCPPRRLGTSFIQVTIINGFYGLANIARGQDTAKITPKTWWENMKRGWEWDLDDFVVNQIGHPYQGNNYFTAGRANGLNFWESAAITAFGSGTWEYFGETNQASLNDFINTTLGGIALGEMFHRTAWLIRDTSRSGKSRLWNEIAATVLDPITGVNRFISGDASRVVEKPRDMVPATSGALLSVGGLGRGSNTDSVPSDGYGFFEADLLYGDLTAGRSRTPYDAFAVRLTFGGGAAMSEARVRGRLFSEPYHGALLTVSQGYQFNANPAYRFGAQAADLNISRLIVVSSRMSMFIAGWGGATILGAVDSIPLTGKVDEPVDPNAPQGVSTGPRYYDYGPGANAGAYFGVMRGNRNVFAFAYELHHLHVLDGVRADHVLQRARADLLLPIKGRLGFGTAAEFFTRYTNYIPGRETARYQFPQFRVFLTWSGS